MWLKGCSSFSLFQRLMMPSDLISDTASSTVSSLTQTRLLAAKFLQPAAVLLSLFSIQSTDHPTAKIPLAAVISTFAFECFHWLTMFWMKFKFHSAFSDSVCILFIACVLTIQHPLTSPRPRGLPLFSSYPSLFLKRCSPNQLSNVTSTQPHYFHIPFLTFLQEPVIFLLIFCFVDGKNCFIRNILFTG